MKKFASILLLLFPVFLFGQKILNLGQGVIKIDIGKMPVLDFFTDTTEREPGKTVAIAKDGSGEFILRSNAPVETWFNPEQLFLSYDIFVIRVDTAIGKWLRVYTNNMKGHTMWIKKGGAKDFIEWPAFLLKEVSTIDKDPAFKQDIKTTPNDQSSTIKKMEEADCFKVTEIKGDWLQIQTNADCSGSKKPIKSGWIKWRKNNKLAIGYALIG